MRCLFFADLTTGRSVGLAAYGTSIRSIIEVIDADHQLVLVEACHVGRDVTLQGSRPETARKRERKQRVSHANGARRRSGARESVSGSPRGEAPRKRKAGYGDRTRLTGLGSQGITTMLSPRTVWRS
jgi:hypothetical protein